MTQFEIKIESIAGGIGPSYQEIGDNQYMGGVAIDPEAPIISPYPAMAMTPTRATKFSGANITGSPMWFITNGQNSNLYTYTNDKKFVSYSGTLASETLVYTFGVGAGNGAAYYNDYVYLVSASDVNRYGPLDGSPAMVVSAWTGATLGSQQALSATNGFPATGNMTYPSHPMHVHNDGKLYFGDYVSASGRSCLNYILTTSAGSNNGSLRRALDLPFGYMVNDIESFGPDLAILCSPIGQYTSGSIPKSGRSALFLWDTFSSVPYRQIDISDPIATALYNHNGQLRIWSGQIDGWVRLQGYTGSNSLISLDYITEGSPPPAGAVDALGDMLAYGSYGTIPAAFCGVMTRGYRNPKLPDTARNNIQTITSLGTNARVTALAFINSASKYPIVGWQSDSAAGIDQAGGAGNFSLSYWRSKQFNIGQEFEITRIRIPLGTTIGANTFLSPTILLDNDSNTISPNQIGNTVYNGQRIIDIKQPMKGSDNFALQLNWAGTTLLPVMLPIVITVRTLKDHE